MADRRVRRVGLRPPQSREPGLHQRRAAWAGELAFGVVNASLDLSYSRTIVFFTFEGFDEGDEVNGSGSAGRPLIEKSRFGVFYEGLVWEVDEFQGDNAVGSPSSSVACKVLPAM